ncbi:DNA repair protein RecO [Pokkaliibacter sp. CJK22405]|uniref:DNA repair protein RecO n=1 Tax=Pokkaliibacter sp. CJK22405 TaxID=3384615 RepID=UPI003984C598
MSGFDAEPAFLLHGRPYRETSILAEYFTFSEGRVGVLVRGARRPGSKLRGTLQPFLPVLLSVRGRSSLKTLQNVELQGMGAHLQGKALISGFYLNELLCRLLQEGVPAPRLYATYEWALNHLTDPEEVEPVLRRFEKELLQELGVGLELDRHSGGMAAVEVGQTYSYLPDQGFVPALEGWTAYPGEALLAIHHDDYEQMRVRKVAKHLFREALKPLLGDRPLHSRSLFFPARETS